MSGGYFQTTAGLHLLGDPSHLLDDASYRAILRAKAQAATCSGTVRDIYEHLVNGYELAGVEITPEVGRVIVDVLYNSVFSQANRNRVAESGPGAAGIDLFFGAWPCEHPQFVWAPAGNFEIPVATETIDGEVSKCLECTSGVGSYDNAYFDAMAYYGLTASQLAYGEWDMWVKKHVDSSGMRMMVVSQNNLSAAGTAVGAIGYFVTVNSNEALGLYTKAADGSITALYRTENSFVTNGAWHNIRLTRSASGVFTLYFDGAACPATGAAGTNPVTNTTYTTGGYQSLVLYNTDKLGLASLETDTVLYRYTPLE